MAGGPQMDISFNANESCERVTFSDLSIWGFELFCCCNYHFLGTSTLRHALFCAFVGRK